MSATWNSHRTWTGWRGWNAWWSQDDWLGWFSAPGGWDDGWNPRLDSPPNRREERACFLEDDDRQAQPTAQLRVTFSDRVSILHFHEDDPSPHVSMVEELCPRPTGEPLIFRPAPDPPIPVCQAQPTMMCGTINLTATPAQPTKTKIFCDLDGVLADFDAGVLRLLQKPPREAMHSLGVRTFWELLEQSENFFATLPRRPRWHRLWAFLVPHNAQILSGCPRGAWAQPQKQEWCKRYLNIAPHRVNFVVGSKSGFASPGAILIDDDWEKHQPGWVAKGGLFVHFRGIEAALEELSQILVPSDPEEA